MRFWQDGWYGDQFFQVAFPGLYGISIDKEAFVEASLSRQGAEDRRIWDVRFIREFNNWEMDEGLHFLRILGANTPSMDVGDRLRWMLKPKGILTSDCIITNCWILPMLSFLGKVYGELRSLDVFLSSFGV